MRLTPFRLSIEWMRTLILLAAALLIAAVCIVLVAGKWRILSAAATSPNASASTSSKRPTASPTRSPTAAIPSSRSTPPAKSSSRAATPNCTTWRSNSMAPTARASTAFQATSSSMTSRAAWPPPPARSRSLSCVRRRAHRAHPALRSAPHFQQLSPAARPRSRGRYASGQRRRGRREIQHSHQNQWHHLQPEDGPRYHFQPC